jgi:hypothetical protein
MVQAPVELERTKRLELMSTLSLGDMDDLEPGRLRDLGVYGGAQGYGSIRSAPGQPGMR